MAIQTSDDLVDALHDLYAVGGNKLVQRAAIEHEALRLIADKLYRAAVDLRDGRANPLIVEEALLWYEATNGKTV